jgi:hypothetical protein
MPATNSPLKSSRPLGDDWDLLTDAKAVHAQQRRHGRALIRLAEGDRFDIELTLYKQIEKYIDSPKASTATPSLRSILLNRKDENRERRTRLKEQLASMFMRRRLLRDGPEASSSSVATPPACPR